MCPEGQMAGWVAQEIDVYENVSVAAFFRTVVIPDGELGLVVVGIDVGGRLADAKAAGAGFRTCQVDVETGSEVVDNQADVLDVGCARCQARRTQTGAQVAIPVH